MTSWVWQAPPGVHRLVVDHFVVGGGRFSEPQVVVDALLTESGEPLTAEDGTVLVVA